MVAGGLGVIIPPSISYIVYSAAANASPSKLFTAGIIPGILIGFSLMVYSYYYCRKHGEDKEKLLTNYNEIRQRGFWRLLKDSFWALLTPVIIWEPFIQGCAVLRNPLSSVCLRIVCLYLHL